MIDGPHAIKLAAGALAGVSLVAGVFAAYLWYQSAQSGLDANETEQLLNDQANNARLAEMLVEGANLNKRAAIWTAISVAAGGLCTAMDHMA